MTDTPPRTAASLLVECLAAEGCEYVFSVPGEETMDVLDALSRQDAVRHVTTRHEQGAAFMADVYGRLTGRAAVAMATLGPGATNLVTGIADAFLDHAPMVAITGQTGLDKLHKESHQFVDIVRMLEPVTKWNQRVELAGAVPEIVRKAFRVAQLEKPGPTHIELPENLAATPVPDDLRPIEPTKAYFPEPTDEAIEHAARLLAGLDPTARPGRQRRPAPRRLRRAAGVRQGLHVPVAVTFMGKGAIDDRSHLSLMAVGLQARDHVLSGFDRADLVVSVGYDLVEYAPSRWNPDGRKRIIHIDTQPAEVDADYQPEVELIGDIDGTLRRLLAGGPAARDRRPERERAPRGPRDARPPGPAHGAARRPRAPSSTTTAGRSSPRRRSSTSAARSGRGHRRQRRRRPQDLGRAAVPGLRAEHGDHLERVRGDGDLAAGGDRGQARPPGPARGRPVRRRRVPDELAGARDGPPDRREHHGRRLARRRLRPHRLEAADRVRAPVRRRVHEPGLRRLRPVVRAGRLPAHRRPRTCTPP